MSVFRIQIIGCSADFYVPSTELRKENSCRKLLCSVSKTMGSIKITFYYWVCKPHIEHKLLSSHYVMVNVNKQNMKDLTFCSRISHSMCKLILKGF